MIKKWNGQKEIFTPHKRGGKQLNRQSDTYTKETMHHLKPSEQLFPNR